jgi:hypothetical protein
MCWNVTAMPEDILEITGAIETVLSPDGPRFSFGRSEACTLCLDRSDVGISRMAGSIDFEGGHWWLCNLSRSRPLSIVLETGLSDPLPTESKRVVDQSVMSVVITGEVRRHLLRLHRPVLDVAVPLAFAASGTATSVPLITPRERFAIVALVEGYLLEHPRHDPRPRTYQEIADRLNLPRSTVMKRIENTRRKMMASGIAGLDAADARVALAEFVLTARLVGKHDLPELDRAVETDAVDLG